MNRKEFMEELEKELTKNNCDEKDEIMGDFEEHFELGKQEDKSEEEVAKLLGSPKEIAEQFKKDTDEEKQAEVVEPKIVSENNSKKENSPLAKILLTIALIFFNLVFVFGIAAGIFGALVGFIVAFVAIAICGIVLIVVGIIGLITGSLFIATKLSAIACLFAGIGVTCLRNITNNRDNMGFYLGS